MTGVVVLFSTLALNLLHLALAFDPSPLQDFCVFETKRPGKRPIIILYHYLILRKLKKISFSQILIRAVILRSIYAF